MKKMLIVSIIVGVAVVAGGLVSYAKYFGPQAVMQTNSDRENCKQGNIFEGVDRQSRFTVLSTCEKAVGIVHDMKGTKEEDGDYQFNLELEQPYKKLLNGENVKQVSDMLVVEIISRDQGTSTVQMPKNGDRIEVYGAWVTDNPHGWNEIHPAWKVKII